MKIPPVPSHGKVRLGGFLAVMLAATAAHAASLVPDRIIPSSGSQISGIIVLQADISGVKYRKFSGGRPKTLAFDKVKEIRWGDAGVFNRAIAEFKSGQYAKALKTARRPMARPPREFWYGPYRRVLMGQCLVELGRPKEALPLFDQVLEKYPQSFYVLGAIAGKARAHLALREYARAAAAAARLDPDDSFADPKASGPYGKIWQLRGRKMQAEALAKVPGRSREAAQLFQKLALVSGKLVRNTPASLVAFRKEIGLIQQAALMGGAQVLVAAGERAKARQWIDGVADQITDKSQRVKMFLMLGDLAMAAAKAATDATKRREHYRSAVLDYMRVYILYRDFVPERRKAMLGAATASELLGTRSDKARARRLYTELVQAHKNSPEARKAMPRLEALGGPVKEIR